MVMPTAKTSGSIKGIDMAHRATRERDAQYPLLLPFPAVVVLPLLLPPPTLPTPAGVRSSSSGAALAGCLYMVSESVPTKQHAAQPKNNGEFCSDQPGTSSDAVVFPHGRGGAVLLPLFASKNVAIKFPGNAEACRSDRAHDRVHVSIKGQHQKAASKGSKAPS